MKKPSDRYRAMEEATQKPEDALIRAYAQCVELLIKAKTAMAAGGGDSATIGTAIRGGHQVLMSLCGALDHEVFPELSSSLEQTYLGLMQSLTTAQIRNDVDEIQRVIDIINDVRNSWEDAVRETGTLPKG